MATPQNKRLRVMVDANVLVAGTAWPRFPYEVLQHAARGDFQLVLSQLIIDESRYVLARIRPASINLGVFETFLRETAFELVPTPDDEEIAANSDLVRDINDIHVALAAIGSKVDFLITQDQDFTAKDESTRKVRQQLNIIVPGAFLREYMGWSSEQLGKISTRSWFDFNS